MAKFHIDKHGVPAPCKATKGNCPLGGDDTHFDSQEAAQEYIDNKNESEHGLIHNAPEKKIPNIGAYSNESLDFVRSLDNMSVEDGNRDVPMTVLRELYQKNLWNERELDGEEEYIVSNYEERDSFMVEQDIIGGTWSFNERSDEDREKLSNTVNGLDDYFKSIDEGKSVSEAYDKMEEGFVDSVSDEFREKKSIKDVLGREPDPDEELSDDDIQKAEEAFENMVSRDKLYRYVDEDEAGELIGRYKRDIGEHPSEPTHWTTHEAYKATKNFYDSPLYGMSKSTGERAYQVKENFGNWLRSLK